MPMSIPELERALRSLRLSGMTATLQARALQVASHEMDFIEAFSWLVQDELDRRHSRWLDRRYALSGLPERKDLKHFDWSYNPHLPKRDLLELATLKFILYLPKALHPCNPGSSTRRRTCSRSARPVSGKVTLRKPSRCSPCSAVTRCSTAKRVTSSRRSPKRVNSAT